MFLFYSDSCPYCRTLLEEIKRRKAEGVKLVCIEALFAKGQRLPPAIHSVPALLTMPDKKVVFGKSVFDALFLPGSGFLVSGSAGKEAPLSGSTASVAANAATPGEPEPYALSLSSSLSDSFSFVEDGGAAGAAGDPQDPFRSYSWSSIDAPSGMEVGSIEDERPNTKSKKGLPNVEDLRMARETERNNYLNTAQLPPPATSR